MKWEKFASRLWLKPPGASYSSAKSAGAAAYGAGAQEQVRFDPYVVWANATAFRSFTANHQFFRAGPGESWMSIIAEAKPVADISRFCEALESAHGRMYIPALYATTSEPASKRSRFFTARLPIKDLGKLALLPGLLRWELGLPARGPQEGDAAGSATSELGGAADEALSETATQPTSAGAKAMWQTYRQLDAGLTDDDRRSTGLIGVVDYGCALLQTRFRSGRNGPSRLRRVWDQNERRHALPWQSNPRFGYGRMLDRADINAALAMADEGNDELAVYSKLSFLHERADPTRRIKPHSHGTHVLDVAGGCAASDGDRADFAAKADLMFVQLPVETVVDSSGGSLTVHLLDGVQEFVASASADEPIVVVISQGTHAGPHVGSSLIERALDDLIELYAGRLNIVFGAGNAREAFYPESIDCHAHLTVKPGTREQVHLEVPPSDDTDTFVEIWYAAGMGDSQLQVAVKAPGSTQAGAAVGVGQAWLAKRSGGAVAAIVHQAHTGLEDGPMALLALAPAVLGAQADAGDARLAVPAGIWTIDLINKGDNELAIDIWVERDDPLRSAKPVWPRLRGQHVTQEGTLNALATGKGCVVVGAMRRNDGIESAYSSHGPTRDGRTVPHLLAAADDSTALPGRHAAATLSGHTVRMSGTSVAAPMVARAMFNSLCSNWSLRGIEARQMSLAELAANSADFRVP